MTKQVLRGRSEELSQALTELSRVSRTGQSAVVLISGDGGIGKTALLQAVVEQATRSGVAVGLGAAEERNQIAPGAPLLVALRSGAHPLLNSVVFGALAEVYEQPLWLADRIAAALEELSGRSPIMIAIDDAQWADRLTRFALRILVGRLAASPVFWLLTSREPSSELAGDLAGAARDGVRLTRIRLGPLAESDLDALARDHLGSAPTGPVRRWLHKVGGNPFLAVRLLEGATPATRAEDLPESLIDEFRRRMRVMPEGVVELIRLTAVWGRSLELATAASLLRMTPDQAANLAEIASRENIVEITGEAIGFRHDLVREAVYAAVPVPARRTLHRQCAEHLLATGAGPAAAAAHAAADARTGEEWAAIILVEAAAAVRPTMLETARELLQKAFELLPAGHRLRPGTGEQYADVLIQAQRGVQALTVIDALLTGVHDPEVEARLQLAATRSLWLTGSLDELSARVENLLARPGVPPSLRARLAATRALSLTRSGEPRIAAAAAQDALTQADAIQDNPARLLALQTLGEVARNEGRHPVALVHFRNLREHGGPAYQWEEIRALQLLDRFDEAQAMLTAAAAQAESSQEDLLPSLMHAQLWQEFNLSCLEEAETTAHTIIRLGDERGHLVHRLGAWTMLSGIALTRGDTALARRHLEPVVADDLASRARDDIRVLGLRLLQAWILAAEGNLGESRDLLGPLIASAKDSHRYWPWWPTWPSLFVRVGMGVQDDTFTAQALELALLGAERNPGVPSFEGVALQAQGLVRHDTALLGSAVEALRLSPRPSLLAGALTTYGKALMEQGDRDRSLTILDEAWDLNRRHGAISGLNAVAGILRQAGIRPRSRVVPPTLRPSTGWPSLTKSEFKVAELVSRGHTNRSAAAALSVSVNTVGTHLRSVFGKLNVRSRVELSNAWHAWQTDPPTPV